MSAYRDVDMVDTLFELPTSDPTTRLAPQGLNEALQLTEWPPAQRRDSWNEEMLDHHDVQKLGAMHEAAQDLQVAQPAKPRKQKARDVQRPPALAATHPANYHAQVPVSNTMLPPPRPCRAVHAVIEASPSRSSSTWSRASSSAASVSTSPSASRRLAVPWQIYTDPMLYSSTKPEDVGVFCTGRGPETALKPGLVISPVPMVVLPCGSLVEVANVYPDDGATVVETGRRGAFESRRPSV